MPRARIESFGGIVSEETEVKERDILPEDSQLGESSFVLSIPGFSLNARFVREFILQKDVCDLIILVSVLSPAIRLKFVVAYAPRKLVLDG